MKGKGKGWGKLTGSRKKEYDQTSIRGGHKGSPGGSKFLGETKGNRDLPTNRTKGVKSGVGDPLGAGG